MLLPIVLLHGKESYNKLAHDQRNPLGQIDQGCPIQEMIQISWEKMLRISHNVAQSFPQNFNVYFIICYNKFQILIKSYFTKAKSSENGYLFEVEWEGEGGGR